MMMIQAKRDRDAVHPPLVDRPTPFGTHQVVSFRKASPIRKHSGSELVRNTSRLLCESALLVAAHPNDSDSLEPVSPGGCLSAIVLRAVVAVLPAGKADTTRHANCGVRDRWPLP